MMREKRETHSSIVLGGGGQWTGLNGGGITPLIPSFEREKEKCLGFENFKCLTY